MLLYLIKYLRSDIANAVSELDKVMNGANKAVLLEMHCVIKYVLNTEILGSKIEPNRNKNEPSQIACFGDGNDADDLDTR